MSQTTAQWGATAVEDVLGDAFDLDNPYSVWAPGTALDAAAREAGLHLAVVPPELGGNLTDLAQVMLAVRSAARRDLSVMPATMISVTALTVALVAEDDVAATRIADAIVAGETVGFAMSEEASGSDVLATTARLTDTDDGYLLNGHKWLMGGGSRCRLAVVVAAHEGRRGPGASSAVLVELPREAVQAATPTIGMARCEFSDLLLVDVPVAKDAIVGAVGRGLELAMRAQQLVRTLSTTASVSAMDTGQRLAVRHLDAARAAGRRTADDRATTSMLGACSVELVLADVVTSTAARLLQLSPESAGLSSSIVKHLAPTLARRHLIRAGDLLGARSVLADGPGGVLERMRADAEVVRYIDTSVAANLRTIALHLSTYDGTHLVPSPDRSAEIGDLLQQAFDLERTPPPLDFTKLALRPAPDDPVVLGLEQAALGVANLLEETDPALSSLVLWVWDMLRDVVLTQAEARADCKGQLVLAPSVISDLTWIWAAACCVHLWWTNHSRSLYGGVPGWTGWLRASLEYVHGQVQDPRDPEIFEAPAHEDHSHDATRERVVALTRQGKPVSWHTFDLADRQTGEPEQET